MYNQHPEDNSELFGICVYVLIIYYQFWYLLGVDLVRLPLALEEKDIHDVELLLHIAHALLQLLKPRLDSGARVQVGGAGRDRLYKNKLIVCICLFVFNMNCSPRTLKILNADNIIKN